MSRPRAVEDLLEARAEVSCEPAPNTDRANADRFIRQHGDAARWCESLGGWFFWDGQRWACDDLEVVERLAQETLRSVYREAASETDDTRRQMISRWAISGERGSGVQRLLSFARPHLAERPARFDADPMLLNCENGTVNLQTGELRQHDRGDFLTRRVPVEYDRAATAPRWAAFLERVVPDPAVRAFLARAVGYSLTGNVSEEVLFFLFGLGANGKSVFLNVLRALLGDYARTAAATLLVPPAGNRDSDPAAVAGLKGSRFVVTIDRQEDGRRLAEAQVKQVVSKDEIAGRFLYGQWFEFEPTHHLWLAANHKPIVRGVDDGIWRRLALIPFNVKIPEAERDLDLETKLCDELPGILRWAVEGCLEWQRTGLDAPQAVRAAVDEYRTDSDVLADFIAEHIRTDPGGVAPIAEIYAAYTFWSATVGIKHPVTQKRLSNHLCERGFDRDRETSGRRRWGFRDIEVTSGASGGDPIFIKSPRESKYGEKGEKPILPDAPDVRALPGDLTRWPAGLRYRAHELEQGGMQREDAVAMVREEMAGSNEVTISVDEAHLPGTSETGPE